jgi:hypothetical protein
MGVRLELGVERHNGPTVVTAGGDLARWGLASFGHSSGGGAMTDNPNAESASGAPVGEVAAAAAGPAPEVAVLTIGEIVVSPHWVVTPSGNAALAGSQWVVSDQTRSAKKHPVWTIVLAVLLFPIGLLFLLITNEDTVGYVEVKVRGDGLAYTAQVPVRGPDAVQTIRRQVAQAESMAAALDAS